MVAQGPVGLLDGEGVASGGGAKSRSPLQPCFDVGIVDLLAADGEAFRDGRAVVPRPLMA